MGSAVKSWCLDLASFASGSCGHCGSPERSIFETEVIRFISAAFAAVRRVGLLGSTDALKHRQTFARAANSSCQLAQKS